MIPIVSQLVSSYGGEEGIRTLVGLPPNGFQDRLVMTASIPLRLKAGGDEFQHAVCVRDIFRSTL